MDPTYPTTNPMYPRYPKTNPRNPRVSCWNGYALPLERESKNKQKIHTDPTNPRNPNARKLWPVAMAKQGVSQQM